MVTSTEGAALKDFKLEVNGKTVAEETELSSTTDSKIAKYNQFLIRTKNSGGSATVDLDNFIVEKFNLPDFEISDPEFFQGETETPMTDLNDSDILRTKVGIKANVDAASLSSGKATLIVTLYENNSRTPLLVQAAMGTAELVSGETAYAEARLDLSGFTREQRDNMMVNVMVWDDMNGMHPLMPCKSM